MFSAFLVVAENVPERQLPAGQLPIPLPVEHFALRPNMQWRWTFFDAFGASRAVYRLLRLPSKKWRMEQKSRVYLLKLLQFCTPPDFNPFLSIFFFSVEL